MDGGASTQAVAGMLRSRTGVGGRSAVWIGVSSSGRWSYFSAGPGTLCSPAPVDPLLEVWPLGADRRVVAVTRQHERVGRELGEQALVERCDDGGEVAALEARVARASGEQRVAAEQHGEPSTRKHIEPGVWPGVWIVRRRRRPTVSTVSSSRIWS